MPQMNKTHLVKVVSQISLSYWSKIDATRPRFGVSEPEKDHFAGYRESRPITEDSYLGIQAVLYVSTSSPVAGH
jgi:hypothetical protein